MASQTRVSGTFSSGEFVYEINPFQNFPSLQQNHVQDLFVPLPSHSHTMEQVAKPDLDGTVEVDETYVGGKKIGWGQYEGRQNKEIVIGIRKRRRT